MNARINALTVAYNCSSPDIKTPVRIQNLISRVSLDTLALWDTGATNSVITRALAHQLELSPISRAYVNGVHGPKEVNVYYVEVTLNNDQITLKLNVTECEALSSDGRTGFLIGMDVITRGDFSITNFEGETMMSFRVPSLQPIDFVKGIKQSRPIVSSKPPGRNDPCSCGSGKKYKNCCGR